VNSVQQPNYHTKRPRSVNQIHQSRIHCPIDFISISTPNPIELIFCVLLHQIPLPLDCLPVTLSFIKEYHQLLTLSTSSTTLHPAKLSASYCAKYTIHCQTLDTVDSAKCLGVTIDSKLPFNSHVSAVSKKANGTLLYNSLISSAETRSKQGKQSVRQTITSICLMCLGPAHSAEH